MDSPSGEEGPSKLNNKRDFTKISYTSFVCLNFKEQTHLLQLVKPNLQSEVATYTITYPTVCLKEDSTDNEYAFHIMHDLNHPNILSMQALCENKLIDDPTAVATFVEPNDGLLWPVIEAGNFADQLNHIPSQDLRNYLSQIAEGIDFLRKKNLYHGNLSWDSTLYHGNTVKLAGFKSREPAMNKEEAQWHDWTCFLAMLEVVSLKASQDSTPEQKYFCGLLDSLINLLKTLDMASLSTIKVTVLEHIFFWKLARRLKFFSHTISLKLKDSRFMKAVSNYGICKKSWDVNCHPSFRQLVAKMNDYREDTQIQKSYKDNKGKAIKNENFEAYDGDSPNDYVRAICGACTHWKQLKEDVDGIIRTNHPTVYSDVKNILEISEREDLPKQSDGSDLPGHHSQGHGASSQRRGPRSESQRRDYRYPPRGPWRSQNQHNYRYPQQIPQRGGMVHQLPLTQVSLPYDGQVPRYAPESVSNTFGQSQANRYGQPWYLQHEPQQNMRFSAPHLNQLYDQPPVGSQDGYLQQAYPLQGWQAPFPYVLGAPFAGLQLYEQAGVPQGGYPHPPLYPNYQSAELGAPFAGLQLYEQAGMLQGGYPQPPLYPNNQSAELGAPFGYYPQTQSVDSYNAGYASVPAAGQAGYASVPAAGQSSANVRGYSSAPAAGQSAQGPAGYFHPQRNPPNYDQ